MKKNHTPISRLLTASVTLFLVSALTLLGQTPTTFNYQAVLRDTDGNPNTDANVNIEMEIHQATETGTIVYSEIHSTTTSEFGLVNLEIGSIDPTTFATIDWSAGPYFVEVSVDGLSMGTSELLTVPYALYAVNGVPGPQGDPGLQGDQGIQGEQGIPGVIENNSVGSAHVIDNSLTVDDLAENSVGSSELADNAVGSAEIATGAVGAAEIAANAVEASELADNSVTTNHIQNATILAEDILEQPGISQTLNTSFISGFTNTGVTTIASVTVTIPGPGYIFITARALMRFDSGSGNTLEQGFIMQIDDTEGGSSISGRYSEVFIQTFSSTGLYIYDQTATATFYRASAGTYTFYFEGMLDRTNRTVTVYWPIMTAIYIPSSVGVVESGSSLKGIQTDVSVSNPTK